MQIVIDIDESTYNYIMKYHNVGGWVANTVTNAILGDTPQTGQWIAFDDRYNKCSKCGFHYDTWNNRTEGLPIIFNYCPSCGMKMEVKE